MRKAKLSEIDSDKVFDLIVPHHFTAKEEKEIEEYFEKKDKKSKSLNGHKKSIKHKHSAIA